MENLRKFCKQWCALQNGQQRVQVGIIIIGLKHENTPLSQYTLYTLCFIMTTYSIKLSFIFSFQYSTPLFLSVSNARWVMCSPVSGGQEHISSVSCWAPQNVHPFLLFNPIATQSKNITSVLRGRLQDEMH